MTATTKKVWLGRLQRKSNLLLCLNLPSVFLLGLGICLFQFPVSAQTATTGATLSFPLKYVEMGASSLSSIIIPGKQEVKFRKEPDFGKDKVLRRALKIGSGKDDYIGFAVNLTSRTLYLDLNQNLDLTDDPQGIHKGQGGGGMALFRNVRLNLHKNGVDRSYLLDPFYFYGRDSCYIAIRSSYRGEIELTGRKWKLAVQDNLDGDINPQDRFSITPVAGNAEANRDLPAYSAMPAAKSLFLGGHQYQLSFVFGTGPESSPLTANFKEITSDLGELVLDGQFIRRLVLEGAALVILDPPTRPIRLPVDKYRIQAIYLQSAPGKPMISGNASTIPQFSVITGTPYHLKIGWPLESSVKAAASGNKLQLSYFLKGAGGEQYSLSDSNRSRPPRFAIYKGNRQLAAGNFEFG